jgi:hypothetical protein
MNFIEQFEGKTKVNEDEVSAFFAHLMSLSDINKTTYKSQTVIDQKEKINAHILVFLEQLMNDELVSKKEDKIEIMKLMDALISRNDLLENIKEKLSSETMQAISKHLRNKSQSSLPS